MEALIFVFFIFVAIFIASFAFTALRRLGRWNRTYEQLGKRYAGQPGKGGVVYGFGMTKPSMNFDYGRTFVSVRNRKSYRFPIGRSTETSMVWPNRKLRFEITTSPSRSRNWGPGAMHPISLANSQFQSEYFLSGNDSEMINRLLTAGVQWQIEQLRRHMRNDQVHVSLGRGNLVVAKPGYIKEYVPLEDFVRFSMDMFDQLMLVDAVGIEFTNANQAAVVEHVKCPICSEEITQNAVVCSRCKTPHCLDCWQYNGQCATFACSETRCHHVGNAF